MELRLEVGRSAGRFSVIDKCHVWPLILANRDSKPNCPKMRWQSTGGGGGGGDSRSSSQRVKQVNRTGLPSFKSLVGGLLRLIITIELLSFLTAKFLFQRPGWPNTLSIIFNKIRNCLSSKTHNRRVAILINCSFICLTI